MKEGPVSALLKGGDYQPSRRRHSGYDYESQRMAEVPSDCATERGAHASAGVGRREVRGAVILCRGYSGYTEVGCETGADAASGGNWPRHPLPEI